MLACMLLHLHAAACISHFTCISAKAPSLLNPIVLPHVLDQCCHLVFTWPRSAFSGTQSLPVWHAALERLGGRFDGFEHACRVDSAKKLRHLLEQIDTFGDQSSRSVRLD